MIDMEKSPIWLRLLYGGIVILCALVMLPISLFLFLFIALPTMAINWFGSLIAGWFRAKTQEKEKQNE